MVNSKLKKRLARLMRDSIVSMTGSYMNYMGSTSYGGNTTENDSKGIIVDGCDNKITYWSPINVNEKVLYSLGTTNNIKYISKNEATNNEYPVGTVSTIVGIMKNMAISSVYSQYSTIGDQNRYSEPVRPEIIEEVNPPAGIAPDIAYGRSSIEYNITEKFVPEIITGSNRVYIQNNESIKLISSILNSSMGKNTFIDYPYESWGTAGSNEVITHRKFEISSSNLDYDSSLPAVRYAGSTTAPVTSSVLPYGVLLSTPGVFTNNYIGYDYNKVVRHYSNTSSMNYSTAMVVVSRKDNMLTTPLAIIKTDRSVVMNGPYMANKVYYNDVGKLHSGPIQDDRYVVVPDTMQRGGYNPTTDLVVSADGVPTFNYGIEAIIKKSGPVGESRYFIGKKCIGFIEDFMSRYLPLVNPDGSESSYYNYKNTYGGDIGTYGVRNSPYRRTPTAFPMVHDGGEFIFFVSYDENKRYWLNKYKIGYINSAVALTELSEPPTDMAFGSNTLYMMYSDKILTYSGSTLAELPIDKSRFRHIYAMTYTTSNSSGLNGLYIAYEGTCLDTEFGSGTGLQVDIRGIYHLESNRHYTDKNIFTNGYDNPDSTTLFIDHDNVVWMSNTKYITGNNSNLSELVCSYYFKLKSDNYNCEIYTKQEWDKARYAKITYSSVSYCKVNTLSYSFRNVGVIYGSSLRSNGDIVLTHETNKPLQYGFNTGYDCKNVKMTVHRVDLQGKNQFNMTTIIDERFDGMPDILSYRESYNLGGVSTTKLVKVSDHKYCTILLTHNYSNALAAHSYDYSFYNVGLDEFTYLEFFIDEDEMVTNKDPYMVASRDTTIKGHNIDKMSFGTSNRNDPDRAEFFMMSEPIAILVDDKNRPYVNNSFCVVKYKDTFAPIFAGEYIQTHGSLPLEWDYDQHKWVEAKAGIISTKRTHSSLSRVDDNTSIGFNGREYSENTTYLAELKGGSLEGYNVEISFGVSHVKTQTGVVVNGEVKINEKFSIEDDYAIEIMEFIVNGNRIKKSFVNEVTNTEYAELEAMTLSVSNIYEGSKFVLVYRVVG